MGFKPDINQTKTLTDYNGEQKPVVTSIKHNLSATMRQLEGHDSLDKFGYNPLVTTATDPEDIWEYGGIYTFSTTADIVSISSSNAGDTQDIIILGQTADGVEVEQTATLNGQTTVSLTTPLWRVYRMENNASTGGDIAGTVYCYVGTSQTAGVPNNATDVRAIIDNGNNQTQMAIYTIPTGKVGFLCRGEVGMQFTGSVGAGNQFARIQYKSRRFGKVFKVKKTFSLLNVGSSIYQDERCYPDIIPSGTDIVITVQEVSDDMGMWATFDIELVDETKFDPTFLTAIGQRGY